MNSLALNYRNLPSIIYFNVIHKYKIFPYHLE